MTARPDEKNRRLVLSGEDSNVHYLEDMAAELESEANQMTPKLKKRAPRKARVTKNLGSSNSD